MWPSLSPPGGWQPIFCASIHCVHSPRSPGQEARTPEAGLRVERCCFGAATKNYRASDKDKAIDAADTAPMGKDCHRQP